MMIVNPAAMGIPAAQADGSAIPWTRIYIGSAFPLTQIGNTTVFGAATNTPGYMATLPYTPIPGDVSSALRFTEFGAGTTYVLGSAPAPAANVESALRFSDLADGHVYLAAGYTPEPANVGSALRFTEFGLSLSYVAGDEPYPASLTTPMTYGGSSGGSAYASYQLLPANLQDPLVFFDASGAYSA
jgi:hypothetical protein